MPRGHGAKPEVRAAELRLASAEASVLASIAEKVGPAPRQQPQQPQQPQRPQPLTLSAIPNMPAAAALDVLESLLALDELAEADESLPRCIACLERCEDLWSGNDDEPHTLPHGRALTAVAKAMWKAESTQLFPHKLFGYACMLLSAIVEAILDDDADFSDSRLPRIHACDLVDATEATLAPHNKPTLASLLAAGLERLMSTPSGSNEDLILLPLRALQSLVCGLAAHSSHGGPDGLGAAPLPGARVLGFVRSGALGAALDASHAHGQSWRVHSSLEGILSSLVGSRADRPIPTEPPSTVGDALLEAGVLGPVVHTIRTWCARSSAMEGLMERSTALLDALTKTNAGRRAARELGAVDALGELLAQWPDNAELQREIKILRAVISCADEGLDAMLAQLGLTGGAPAAAARSVELPYDAAAAEQVLGQMLVEHVGSQGHLVQHLPQLPQMHVGSQGRRIEWGSGDCAGVATYWY